MVLAAIFFIFLLFETAAFMPTRIHWSFTVKARESPLCNFIIAPPKEEAAPFLSSSDPIVMELVAFMTPTVAVFLSWKLAGATFSGPFMNGRFTVHLITGVIFVPRYGVTFCHKVFIFDDFITKFVRCITFFAGFLVAIGQSSHPRHDTENVVVRRIDIDRRRLLAANRVVGEREVERGIVDTGEVAGAAGLVVLGVEREGVDVDANRGDVRVVLVGLDQVEVRTVTLGEAIVAVELDLRNRRGVLARKTLNTRDGVAGLERRAVEPVGEVEGLLTLVLVHRAVAAREGITLRNPDELLARVVEGHLDLVG